MAVKTHRKSEPRLLREQFAGAETLRVDRDKGIIHGVKIVGRKSPNTHGVKCADGKPVEGTEYTLEALREALPAYEGINVNVDHPPKKGEQERSARDRFAWLQEVEVCDEGIFGDLCFLDPLDPLAIKMMAAAEKKPNAFALSHNAYGRGDVIGRRYVITELPRHLVRSVDIVCEGGTNRSLFEGRETMTRKSLKAVIAAAKPEVQKRFKRLAKLLEADYEDMPMDDAGTDAGWEEHLGNMISAIIQSEEMDAAQKVTKIVAAVKVMLKEEEGGETETDASEAEEDDGDDDEKTKEKEAKEARRLKRSKDPAVRQLQERLDLADLREWVREQCEIKDVGCDKALLEGLIAMRERPVISKHLDYLKTKIVKVQEDEEQPDKKRAPRKPAPAVKPGGGTLTLATLKRSLNGR